MRKVFASISFILLLLVGCSTEELTFNGESDMWSSKMNVKQSDTINEIDFELFYKGENEQDIREISYLVEYNSGKFGSEKTTFDEGEKITSSGSCSGCAPVATTYPITVEIEWEGKKEIIYLE